ncbi:CLUMA_CG011298, isoform C [Clunio marinus]|uniref:receptor protein serine/threonine kinase n=1 Tax=Clunio marinus TaxID=568069 RepID=A0A1J1ICB2_9DIPT|nr:CLUMA_CG011298, isoform C [Clunio marinus]
MVAHIKSHRLVTFLIYSSLSIYASHGYTVHHTKDSLLEDIEQSNSLSNNDIVEHLPTPDPAKMSKKPKNTITCHCDHCHDTNYVCETDGVCYFSWELVDGKYHFSKRCLEGSQIIKGRFPLQCYSTKEKVRNQEFNANCCETDFCNDNIVMPPVPLKKPEPLAENMIYIVLFALIATIMAVAMISGIFMRRRKQNSGGPQLLAEESLCGQTLHDIIEMTTSGSGSAGLPLLVQRSIARQIQLEKVIGNGRFGQVWRGRWRGESVAVKIFSSREECSWTREAEIYQTAMLRHDNILGFIAADNKDNGTWTQLWLVTDYHENGSLFDFLTTHTVNSRTMVLMALTIATGLAHLHMDIVGTYVKDCKTSCKECKECTGKPGIAHRDLKSKNILVKANLSCAIGDLGLAVRHNPKTDTIDIPSTHRVGTKRYMAPEVLDDTINTNHFDAFKRADIYAFGLILWEIARRCNMGNIYDDYQLPFFDVVQPDPSIEEMRKVVCIDNQRPIIPNRWQASDVLHSMSKIMKDCWYQNPASRLSALRVKKTLANLSFNEKLEMI